MSTIALAMLAYNEASLLSTIAETLGDRINAAVILSDPPDDDGTLDLAKLLFGHLPGEIAYRPWPDSASTARNEVLDKARPLADYILWLDPDSPLEGTIPDELAAPAYLIETHAQSLRYWFAHLVRSDTPARWVGRVHEYLEVEANDRLTTAHINRAGAGGGIERMLKYDIPRLLEDCAEQPDNPRWPFYLAQSYRDVGRIDDAINAYIRRSEMIGFDEETFFAMYQAGKLSMGLDNTAAEYWLLKAHAYRPTRKEPLVQLAWLYECSGQPHLGLTIKANMEIMTLTSDILFVETT